MSDKFWDFPPDSKIDELFEDRRAHGPYISGALSCSDTGVEKIDRDEWVLYDTRGEEALLWRPKTIIFKLTMLIFAGLIKVVTHDN